MVEENKSSNSVKSSRFDFIKNTSSDYVSSPSSSPRNYSGFQSRRPKYNFPCSKPQQKPSSSFFNRQPINRDYKLNETNLENKENLAQKENKLRMRIVTESIAVPKQRGTNHTSKYTLKKNPVLEFEVLNGSLPESTDSSNSGESFSFEKSELKLKSPSSSSDSDEGSVDGIIWTLSDDINYWLSVGAVPPQNGLLQAISKQISYYLSDEYLEKDKYLLRQIRCKKDGFISIKLMTSFKNIKKLTCDIQVVRCAIVRMCKSVVVSSDGLRVRRVNRLPDHLKKPRLLKTVLAIRLPTAYSNEKGINSLFKIFGEINSIRMLEAGKDVPSDIKNYATQVKDIGQTTCALINFKTTESALDAVRTIKFHLRNINEEIVSSGDKKSSFQDDMKTSFSYKKHQSYFIGLPEIEDCRVALLGPRVRRTLYRQDKIASLTGSLGSSRSISR